MKINAALSAFFMMILVLFPLNAAWGEPVKIGLVDTQKILRESKAAKRAGTAFFKDVEAKRAVLNTKQQEVKALASEFDKQLG